MLCTRFTSSFKSSDNIHDIAYYVYFPTGEMRGVVQISHGMCDYFKRYDEFARFLTEHGFIVCGNDHLGHGNSVSNDDELGYFSEKNGWQHVVEDLFSLTKIMKRSYGDLPYFMLGHSMGSFMARAYSTKHGKALDGLVLCGTSGGVKGLTALMPIIDAMKKLHGDKYRSPLLKKLAFGAYNLRIKDSHSDYDWISRDTDIVDLYNNDKKCTFNFTVNGYDNLTRVLWYVSQEKWFENFRRDLPVLLVAGDGDPVGSYGRGVKSVYDRLRRYSCDVEIKLYSQARHELLNETNRNEVYNDILNFFKEYSWI